MYVENPKYYRYMIKKDLNWIQNDKKNRNSKFTDFGFYP